MKSTLLLLLAACLPVMGGQLARAQRLEEANVLRLPPFFITQSPQELAKQLASNEIKERRAAAKALYFIKWNAQPAIPILTKALKDPDDEVRAMAAGCFYFLDVKPEHGVVPILADLLLNDGNDVVRGSSARTLCRLSLQKDLTGKLGPVFRRALEDKNKYVGIHAATALAKQGQDLHRAMQVLAGFLDTDDEDWRGEVTWAFEDVGLAAVPSLKYNLKHKNPQVRRTTAICLIGAIETIQRRKQELPDELVSWLASALEDSDDDVLMGAMAALRTIGSPANSTIPRMIKFLDHANPEVRWEAAYALRKFGSAAMAAIPRLEKGLSDKDWRARSNSGYALGAIAGKTAIPALETALSDPDSRVRHNAIDALGKMRDEASSVVPVLVKALGHRDREVMSGALSQLERFGTASAPAVPRLAELIQDDDGPGGFVGLRAIETLQSIGPAAKPAIPQLIKALSYEGYLSRIRAAQTLATIGAGPETVVPALIATLGDKEPEVRVEVAKALGRFGASAQGAIPRLTELISDPRSDVRDAAAESLKRINEEKK